MLKEGGFGLLPLEGFTEGGGFRSALVPPLPLVPAVDPKQSEILLLAQGAGGCWALREEFQLVWGLCCSLEGAEAQKCPS